MSADERSKKIEEYGQGFNALQAALAEIPREVWSFKPTAKDWSVHEILVHMGDSESMAALRVRKLIVEPGSTLMGYDEAKWAGVLRYQDQDVGDSVEVVRLARQTTYHLLRTLPGEVFGHSIKHPEYDDPYTLDTWLGIYARHIPDHIEQMKNAYESWKKR